MHVQLFLKFSETAALVFAFCFAFLGLYLSLHGMFGLRVDTSEVSTLITCCMLSSMALTGVFTTANYTFSTSSLPAHTYLILIPNIAACTLFTLWLFDVVHVDVQWRFVMLFLVSRMLYLHWLLNQVLRSSTKLNIETSVLR